MKGMGDGWARRVGEGAANCCREYWIESHRCYCTTCAFMRDRSPGVWCFEAIQYAPRTACSGHQEQIVMNRCFVQNLVYRPLPLPAPPPRPANTVSSSILSIQSRYATSLYCPACKRVEFLCCAIDCRATDAAVGIKKVFRVDLSIEWMASILPLSPLRHDGWAGRVSSTGICLLTQFWNIFPLFIAFVYRSARSVTAVIIIYVKQSLIHKLAYSTG